MNVMWAVIIINMLFLLLVYRKSNRNELIVNILDTHLRELTDKVNGNSTMMYQSLARIEEQSVAVRMNSEEVSKNSEAIRDEYDMIKDLRDQLHERNFAIRKLNQEHREEKKRLLSHENSKTNT